AIVVVLTAPRPTSRTPSFPCAGAMFTGVGTRGNYISRPSSVATRNSRLGTRRCFGVLSSRASRAPSPGASPYTSAMVLNPFVRRADTHTLLVSMTSVKLGDRVAFIGCAHGPRMAAVAAKVGLSGRAVVVAPDETSAARARRGAERAGVLVEIENAPL